MGMKVEVFDGTLDERMQEALDEFLRKKRPQKILHTDISNMGGGHMFYIIWYD